MPYFSSVVTYHRALHSKTKMGHFTSKKKYFCKNFLKFYKCMFLFSSEPNLIYFEDFVAILDMINDCKKNTGKFDLEIC